MENELPKATFTIIIQGKFCEGIKSALETWVQASLGIKEKWYLAICEYTTGAFRSHMTHDMTFKRAERETNKQNIFWKPETVLKGNLIENIFNAVYTVGDFGV